LKIPSDSWRTYGTELTCSSPSLSTVLSPMLPIIVCPFLPARTSPSSLIIPMSTDEALVFSEKWLALPDDTQVPQPGTPGIVFPASGSYPHFETNFTRWAAVELTKRLDPEKFGRKGFMLQAIAAGWHYMSPERLNELGDKVGRERIMVLHGE